MTLDDCRQFYAEEIRVAASLDSSELTRAFATVPRERYLGTPPWKICSGDKAALVSLGLSSDLYTETNNPADLYHNVLIAIDAARLLNNGHPSTLARWISELGLKSGATVYHAGCGVGYYTAVLAEIVGPRGHVVAIDVDEGLADRARQNLAGYQQVSVHSGDGAAFEPGPCDAMLINAGVTHPHRPWLDHLNVGGNLVLPLTARSGNGVMLKITRKSGSVEAKVVSFVMIYAFTTLRDLELEPVLAAALTKRTILNVKSLLLTDHEFSDSCIIHGHGVCLSSAPCKPDLPE